MYTVYMQNIYKSQQNRGTGPIMVRSHFDIGHPELLGWPVMSKTLAQLPFWNYLNNVARVNIQTKVFPHYEVCLQAILSLFKEMTAEIRLCVSIIR